MSTSGVSRLEVFWKGPYSNSSGASTENCEALCIELEKELVIEAPLNTHLPCEEERQLQMQKISDSPGQLFTICPLPLGFFKKMQVRVRFSMDFKTPTTMPDGTLIYVQKCLTRYLKPVPILKMPEFQIDKLYQLQVINNNWKLTGIFKEKIAKLHSAPKSKPIKMKAVSLPLKQPLNSLVKRRDINLEYEDRRFHKFTNFALENMLQALKIKAERAQVDYNRAARNEGPNTLERAMKEKQKIAFDITTIKKELENRENDRKARMKIFAKKWR